MHRVLRECLFCDRRLLDLRSEFIHVYNSPLLPAHCGVAKKEVDYGQTLVVGRAVIFIFQNSHT